MQGHGQFIGVRWRLLAGALALACSNSGGGTGQSDPHAPSELVAGPLGGGVHLTWKDNSDTEESFQIERKSGGAAFALLDVVPFDTALYHDSNVAIGSAYTYRVRVKLPAGFSGYSNEAFVNLADNSTGGGGKSGSGTGGSGTGGSGTAGSGTSASGAPASAGSAGLASTAGSGGSAGAPTGGSAGAAQMSFSKDVAPNLVKSCGSTTNGCHTSDQASGRSMSQFGPCKVIWYAALDQPLGAQFTAGVNVGQPTGCPDVSFYDRLTKLHSMLCDAPSWDQRPVYVVPGDLNASLLYQVIAGDASFGGKCKNMDAPVRRMPLFDPKILPDPVPLSEESIVKIKDWILQGAKNN
jgi:hypothetical protein